MMYRVRHYARIHWITLWRRSLHERTFLFFLDWIIDLMSSDAGISVALSRPGVSVVASNQRALVRVGDQIPAGLSSGMASSATSSVASAVTLSTSASAAPSGAARVVSASLSALGADASSACVVSASLARACSSGGRSMSGAVGVNDDGGKRPACCVGTSAQEQAKAVWFSAPLARPRQ